MLEGSELERRLGTLLAFSAIILASSSQHAFAEIDTSFSPFVVDTESPQDFYLFGPITERSVLNFKRALRKYGTPSALHLDSPGGLVHDALPLALEVHELGLKTRVIDECLSACFFVFAAGKERVVDGVLGVHQMSSESNDLAVGQVAIADMIDVLNQLGVHEHVYVLMLQTPSSEMHEFTRNELALYGLETGKKTLTKTQSTIGPGELEVPAGDKVRLTSQNHNLLAELGKAGLPRSSAQPETPKVYSFRDGDPMEFVFRGRDYPAYFYVDFFDVEGNVVHLLPNPKEAQRIVGVNETLHVAAGPLRLFVSSPFGQEVLTAFVASSQLEFDEPQELIEPAKQYIDALKAAISLARVHDPNFKGEWGYFIIETQPRK